MSDDHGVTKIVVEDIRSDPQPRRCLSRRGQRGERRERVREMVRHEERRVAGRFDSPRPLTPFVL